MRIVLLITTVFCLIGCSEKTDIAQFSIDNETISESAGSVMVIVTRTGNTSSEATVQFNVHPGSAKEGADFGKDLGATLTFIPQTEVVTINITVIDDDIKEGPEFFTVDLTNPTNGKILKSQAIININDDD